jgi:acyl-CoA synthetase (AMP-forming)/AMP-acid ligase II
MILSSSDRIHEYIARGFWGTTTIDDLFRTAVIGGRDRLAIVDAPNKAAFMSTAPLRLSWNELATNVDRLCQRLLAAGVKRDDVIGAQLPNCVELAYLYLAAARLGFILSPFPIQYREHELRDLIGFAGICGFITARSIRGHDHGAMVNDLSTDLPNLRFVLAWGGPSGDGIDTLDDLYSSPPDRVLVADAARRAAVTANDIITITWTSGTEARPKGVPRHHNYWICAGTAVGQAGLLEDGDALLNPFPMVHVGSLGGMFFPWLIWRGVLVQHQPFELDIFLQQIQDEHINYTVAPPAVLNLLMQNDALRKRYNLGSLRSVGSGSAPLSPWMIRAFQEQCDISVWNSFGSSEGCGLFGSSRDVPDPEARANYLPRFGVEGVEWPSWVAHIQETRLVDPETDKVISERGIPGELRLRGSLVLDEYWNAPEQTQAAFDSEGFFRTGDIFELAGDGDVPRYYHYVGRRSEVINRGGTKISPAEIEALIDGHPKVREAAVIGLVDERLGELVCAVVALRDGQSLYLEELVDYLKGKKIAVYKLPQRLFVVPQLPRNPVGKVLKRELRQAYGKAASG